MKTQQLKKTRISETLDLFESNQHIIQRATGLTDLEYKEILFEAGIYFIENLYPRKTAYEEYLVTHAKSKDFWDWFISEWKIHEIRLLKDYELSDIPLTDQAYFNRIDRFPNQSFLERAFQHNYLRR